MMMGKVLSFSRGSTVSSILSGYLALCLALQILRLASAQFTVRGPDLPVAASLGGEAVLHCHLSPRMSAENMEVRWFRAKYSAVVHLYRDGQDQFGEQMLEYQGRTEFLKDDITIGRVSLRIYNIQPSDHGQYTCLFQSSVSYEEALLELRVADLGSDLDISLEGYQDGGIRLVCQSSGWYPQPETEWRDQQGQLLPSASESSSQAAGGLFQIQTAMVLTDVSIQKVSCRIRNPQLNKERESAISIAGLFFPRVNAWMVSVWVILALLAGLIAVASYYFWKVYRAKETLRSARDSEKETLLSDWKEEKEKLRSAMKQQKADYEAMKELGLMRARGYAVDVTLDPDTAHPNLVLSEGRKRATYGNTRQALPNTPERFDPSPCVLGTEGFAGGRRYWEVEVGDKTEWYLGVCRESVSRKASFRPTPSDGYWAVWQSYGTYQACTSPLTPLPVSAKPARVGIFLDYEAGEVSFYNVTDRSQLFMFTDTFSETLHPYFHTGYNAAPLTIYLVPAQTGETGSTTS
ncbi:butyrophilin subfamily 1 member A1-like [Pelodiscus sinensis]|uniref:butyrophilin subfamily 1 member A1-like n=1 Tax=Pelodiscus sinensis TaxID=13735 RepID=UPI003F6A65FB